MKSLFPLPFSPRTVLRGTLCLCLSSFGNPTLINLPANSWYTVPNSPFRPFCPSETQYPGIRGTGGCAMVVEAWSGGCYIPGHKKMIVWGGGHNDYYGNEIYAFDMETLKWSLLRQPSTPNISGSCVKVLPGGAPVSRHTYDGLTYMAHVDRMFAFGGSGACQNGDGVAQTWALNATDATWRYMNPPASNIPKSCCSGTSGFSPYNNKVYYHDNMAWFAYDYSANLWTRAYDIEQWGDKTSTVDTQRGLLITIGNGIVWAADLKAATFQIQTWSTSGGSSIVGAQAPGITYDSKADRVLGWAGGAVYSFNVDTKVWSQLSGSGAPSSQAGHGTYGRFRYVPEYNVCVLVNGVDENVRFFKNTAGGGTAVERAPARPSVRMPGSLIWDAYNLQGRLLRRNVNENAELRNYPAGLYLLRAHSGERIFTRRKIVIQ